MEKFGIFELLDALAALASENAPPQESGEAETPRAQEHGEAETPRAQEHGEAETPRARESENAPPPQAERNARALGDFLARHERVSKNAGRRK